MNRFSIMQSLYGEAVTRAPALRERFEKAGLSPADLTDASALSRLPVLTKERLMDLQAANPPFAGFLSCDITEIAHIYVSPGPICEPGLARDKSGHGMDKMFKEAGIGPGDIALNSWAYHLVPAGMLFDQGLCAVGATVIPSGTGNTALQAKLLCDLKATVFLGSTAYFATLVEQLTSDGRELPADWHLKHAFLGGEFGDWTAKRRAIESRYGLKTWSCYATADFGLIGFERAGEDGYRIHNDRYVQICDPVSGAPLPLGQSGEIVVTTLARGWPMIRFGTGDVAHAITLSEDGGAERISPLEGRTGAAVKAREIFIYPGHIEALVRGSNQITAARAEVSEFNGRDHITLELVNSGGAGTAPDEEAVRTLFQSLTRLRADHVRWLESEAEFTISGLLVDNKTAQQRSSVQI
ncbi:phenylacetate--CoA ligase family protein [Sneathiella sp.]|uniref:phenylacetate--CoA ligase family protein n=1 Tax=Sneathiella sp. TaxID=1964365 RepID=UPI002FE2E47C